MNHDNKELVWVEKEFAEKYKILENKAEQNGQRVAMFEEYIKIKGGSPVSRFTLTQIRDNLGLY